MFNIFKKNKKSLPIQNNCKGNKILFDMESVDLTKILGNKNTKNFTTTNCGVIVTMFKIKKLDCARITSTTAFNSWYYQNIFSRAIATQELTDEIKAFVRRGDLYLITKKYFEDNNLKHKF